MSDSESRENEIFEKGFYIFAGFDDYPLATHGRGKNNCRERVEGCFLYFTSVYRSEGNSEGEREEAQGGICRRKVLPCL
jgi:hypothetical protein